MLVAAAAAIAADGEAAAKVVLDQSPDRVVTPLKVELKRIGTLRPRAAHEIKASNWTLGCEVLDRDFANFEEYKEFIDPLGIKTVRLQGGWAKCEKEMGKYDFAWLDRIIDYCVAKGINVLLETDYGNPIYEGGGGWDLAGGFPTSEEGLAAWDAWVDALSKHFKGKVRDWAMWNEPDIGLPKKTPESIAAFNVRTAKVIKRNIPDARLAGLSLARNEADYFESCLKPMGEDVKLFDWFIYHGYAPAPESSYENVEEQKAVLARYNPAAKLRQGENGCPSEMATRFALSGYPWSEYSQAKWDMRRMLGDLGHDVESSVFTICDFNHKGREINLKGILRANDEKEVIAVKRAYYAVQNVVSVFDSSWTRVKEPAFVTTDATIATYEYRKETGERLYVFWKFADETKVVAGARDTKRPGLPGERRIVAVPARPGDSFETRMHVFKVSGETLRDPVFVDLLTGAVYSFPKANVIPSKTYTRFIDVPVYDSPCLLAERSALEVVESRTRAVRLALPGTIYAAPGVECSIYYANILDTVKPQLYCFDARCAVGRNQAERFVWTPTAEDAGREVPLEISAVLEGVTVDTARTVIRVARQNVDKAKPVALATLAASLTGSRYPDFVLEGMKADGFTGFREVGSHSGAGRPVMPGGPAHDGYGGFTFGSFLTRWMMHESELPLLQDDAERDQLRALGLASAKKKSYALRSPLVQIRNGQKVVDVQAWIDKVNGGKPPEVVFIELGCNHTFTATDDVALHRSVNEYQIPSARKLLAHLREKCPKALIGIALEALGSGQDGYAANYGCHYSEANWRRNVFVLNRALERFVKESGDPRLMIVPFGHAISRDYSYLTEEVPAHAHTERKIIRDRNALHCGSEGGRQFADAIRCWLENVWPEL